MKRILFACVGNSFRSQIAEAYARHWSDPAKVEIRSGGTAPSKAVHPNVEELMRDVGVRIDGAAPKPIDLAFADRADAFVTLCGPVDSACPARIARKAIDWNIEDPSWSDVATMQRIRDLIGRKVRALLSEHGVLAQRS